MGVIHAEHGPVERLGQIPESMLEVDLESPDERLIRAIEERVERRAVFGRDDPAAGVHDVIPNRVKPRGSGLVQFIGRREGEIPDLFVEPSEGEQSQVIAVQRQVKVVIERPCRDQLRIASPDELLRIVHVEMR